MTRRQRSGDRHATGAGRPRAQRPAGGATVDRVHDPSSLEQQTSEQDRFLGRHEFFDTKHRFVNYMGKATSVFTEHYEGSSTFAVPSPGTATPLDLPGHTGLGLEDGSVTVTGSDGTPYTENTDFTLDLVAGTITFTAPPADRRSTRW